MIICPFTLVFALCPRNRGSHEPPPQNTNANGVLLGLLRTGRSRQRIASNRHRTHRQTSSGLALEATRLYQQRRNRMGHSGRSKCSLLSFAGMITVTSKSTTAQPFSFVHMHKEIESLTTRCRHPPACPSAVFIWIPPSTPILIASGPSDGWAPRRTEQAWRKTSCRSDGGRGCVWVRSGLQSFFPHCTAPPPHPSLHSSLFHSSSSPNGGSPTIEANYILKV